MKGRYLSVILAVLLVVTMVQSALASPNQQGAVHNVQYGETLSQIAAQYGVSVQAIMQYNQIYNPNSIYAGQSLVIPINNYTPVGPTGGYATPSCSNYHLVTSGETLSSIAEQYNSTVQTLQGLNGLVNQDMVYAGQKLCIPDPAGFAPPIRSASGMYQHQVSPGDTLIAISQEYGVSPAEIVQVNGLQDGDMLITGQALAIPGYDVLDVPFPPQPTPIAPSAPPKAQSIEIIKPPAPEHLPEVSFDGLPPAPDYQTAPQQPLLPLADSPIMVEVMGQDAWVADVYVSDESFPHSMLMISTPGEVHDVVIRSGDYEVRGRTDMDAEFGAFKFVFRFIPPGDYDVWVDDPALTSQKAHIRIEGGTQAYVTFGHGMQYATQTYASPSGWFLAAANNPSVIGQNTGGWGNILVRGPASGLHIILESEGGFRATCLTGSKGENGCDFAGLNAGYYFISIDGTDFKIKTYLDGSTYASFDFGRQPAASADKSNVVGPYFIYGPKPAK